MTPNKPLTAESMLSHYGIIAKAMEMLSAAKNPKLDYHLMAGAVYWSDEIPGSLDWLAENSLRPVLRYRTSMLLGKPESAWERFWLAAKAAFPKWIGFSETRCTPTSELAKHIRDLEKRSLSSSV